MEDSSLSSLKRLWPYLKKYRRRMLFGILCVMGSNAMAVVSPWVLKLAIDTLSAGRHQGYGRFAWAILGATVIQGMFLFLMRRVMIGVSRDIEYELRNDLYAHMQVLSSSYYNKMYTGDLMSRANNDLAAVRMVLGPAIMYSINTVFTSLLSSRSP
jgi:ATP-binding cassette subfamily B multidrug efflux pump